MITLAFNLLNFLSVVGLSTISVCSNGCDFASVKEAIQHSLAGQELVVHAGVYKEGPLLIDHPLFLRGQGYPTLVGDGTGSVLTIKADSVTIEGLRIIDSGASYISDLAGIKIEEGKNCEISNNRLENNAYGVYLARAERCLVQNNIIDGTRKSESESGNGVHIWDGHFHTIKNNTISGHRDGIYFEFAKDGQISGNRVFDNIRYGLHFMSSDRNVYTRNIFERNGAGVAVMYSKSITMVENVFQDNRGMSSYGLLLKDISGSEIARNTFSDNTIGIYMEGTLRSSFLENRFNANGYATRIYGDCDGNTFRHNNYVGNTFNIVTNSSRNPNTFTENYWSTYEGFDLDGDGFGDVPYRPVSLASSIVEGVDSSFVLINSFFFLVMEEVEQAFPELIPEPLKDLKPLMRPWTGEGIHD